MRFTRELEQGITCEFDNHPAFIRRLPDGRTVMSCRNSPGGSKYEERATHRDLTYELLASWGATAVFVGTLTNSVQHTSYFTGRDLFISDTLMQEDLPWTDHNQIRGVEIQLDPTEIEEWVDIRTKKSSAVENKRDYIRVGPYQGGYNYESLTADKAALSTNPFHGSIDGIEVWWRCRSDDLDKKFDSGLAGTRDDHLTLCIDFETPQSMQTVKSILQSLNALTSMLTRGDSRKSTQVISVKNIIESPELWDGLQGDSEFWSTWYTPDLLPVSTSTNLHSQNSLPTLLQVEGISYAEMGGSTGLAQWIQLISAVPLVADILNRLNNNDTGDRAVLLSQAVSAIENLVAAETTLHRVPTTRNKYTKDTIKKHIKEMLEKAGVQKDDADFALGFWNLIWETNNKIKHFKLWPPRPGQPARQTLDESDREQMDAAVNFAELILLGLSFHYLDIPDARKYISRFVTPSVKKVWGHNETTQQYEQYEIYESSLGAYVKSTINTLTA